MARCGGRGGPGRSIRLWRRRSLGIVAVHQELTLVDTLSVAQNIWLGHEPFGRMGTIDYKEMDLTSAGLIQSMGVSLDPSTLVGKLSLSEKQLVEILKALSLNPRLLILDEATSTLDDKEVEMLHGIVSRLRSENRAVLFVSHRMKEIFQFCEYCSVMKDGKVVFEDDIGRMDEQLIITKMTGREITQAFPVKNQGEDDRRRFWTSKGSRRETDFMISLFRSDRGKSLVLADCRDTDRWSCSKASSD